MPRRPNLSIAQRLEAMSMPEPNSGCQLWLGGVANRRYGTLKINRQHQRAHRVAWEMANGPIPKGLVVCHRCDNTFCINPAHLIIGTQADNMADMVAKGRSTGHGTSRKGGERHGMAKLTEAQVLAIRADDRTPSAVAADYQITPRHARDIINRKKWEHV